jgi:ABC-type antimicrobial peptide transport system permease subunit
LALGADPKRILTTTLGQGGLTLGFGLIAGGMLSMWATRALRGFTFAADRFDFSSIVVAAAVLVVAGCLAILPAARRAARTDPMMVLRSE